MLTSLFAIWRAPLEAALPPIRPVANRSGRRLLKEMDFKLSVNRKQTAPTRLRRRRTLSMTARA